MPTKCKVKQAQWAREHYERNRQKVKDRARLWTVNQARYLKRLTNRYKMMVGCKSCAYRKCVEALEFHHRDASDKDNHVADMIHNGVSTKRLKAEVRKCIVVCANCHRELHARS